LSGEEVTMSRSSMECAAAVRFATALHVLFAAVVTPLSAATNAPLFALNGWQFHEYNIPKLEEAVRKAPSYGVNFLIFSHGFFWSTEGFLASIDDLDPQHPPAYPNDLQHGDDFMLRRGWQSDLRHISDLATERIASRDAA